YFWTPTINDVGSTLRIKISSTSTTDVFDYSNLPFDIQHRYLSISGKLTDDNGKALKFATVQLEDALIKDQSQTKGDYVTHLTALTKTQTFQPTGNFISRVDLDLISESQSQDFAIVEIA